MSRLKMGLKWVTNGLKWVKKNVNKDLSLLAELGKSLRKTKNDVIDKSTKVYKTKRV